MSSLDLEMCRRLAEAGFPQDKGYAEYRWYVRHTGSTEGPKYHDTHDYPGDRARFDSPNSDELIAWIAGTYDYSCWQDVVGHMEASVDDVEHDLNQSLAEFAIQLLTDSDTGPPVRRSIWEGSFSLGKYQIDCAVLDDGTRVITEDGLNNFMAYLESGNQADSDEVMAITDFSTGHGVPHE